MLSHLLILIMEFCKTKLCSISIYFLIIFLFKVIFDLTLFYRRLHAKFGLFWIIFD